MIRWRVVVLSTFFALHLCSQGYTADSLSFYRYPLAHTGYYPHESMAPSPRLTQKYGLLNIDTHNAGKSSPIVDDGVIYVGSDFGFLFAINELNMKTIWGFSVRPVRKGIHATPAIDQNRVYIGAYDGWLYALAKSTGRLVWQTRLRDSIGSSPVIWNDRLYVGVETSTRQGYLSCVDKNTGKLLFRSLKFADHTHSTPALNPATATVFIGANDHRFYALDAFTGRLKWEYETRGAIKSTAALFENSVLFTSWDGHLYNLSQRTGELHWRFPTRHRTMSSPAIDTDKRMVYFGSHDSYLYAVDLDHGWQHWAFKTGQAVASSPILVRNAETGGTLVIFGSADTNLYGLDAATGRLHFQFPTGHYVTNVPLVKQRRLYVSGKDGWLYILQ